MLKPVVFHKGDFYLREEYYNSRTSGCSPIFPNDGETEIYYHDLGNVNEALKLIENLTNDNKFSFQIKDVERGLIYLKYCIEKHRLPYSTYTIGDVE